MQGNRPLSDYVIISYKAPGCGLSKLTIPKEEIPIVVRMVKSENGNGITISSPVEQMVEKKTVEGNIVFTLIDWKFDTELTDEYRTA